MMHHDFESLAKAEYDWAQVSYGRLCARILEDNLRPLFSLADYLPKADSNWTHTIVGMSVSQESLKENVVDTVRELIKDSISSIEEALVNTTTVFDIRVFYIKEHLHEGWFDFAISINHIDKEPTKSKLEACLNNVNDKLKSEARRLICESVELALQVSIEEKFPDFLLNKDLEAQHFIYQFEMEHKDMLDGRWDILVRHLEKAEKELIEQFGGCSDKSFYNIEFYMDGKEDVTYTLYAGVQEYGSEVD